MARPTGFNMTEENIEWCEMRIEEGWFTTISDVIDFALKLYLMEIRKGMNVRKLRRETFVRRNVRVNEWVLDELTGDGFSKSEVADYAIDNLRTFMGGSESKNLNP